MIRATRQYIDGITTALTQENGIKITAGKAWRADIKERELEYKASDLVQLSPMNAKGLILHEVGHLLYTKDNKETELEKSQPLMHEVYNAFEDIRIEKLLSGKYGDFADKPLAINKATIAGSTPQITDDSPASILHQALSHTIYDRTHYETGQFAHANRNPAYTFSEKMSEGGRRFIQEHSGELKTIADHAMECKTLDELKTLIDDQAYPILKPLLDAIPPQQQRELAQQESKKEINKAGPLSGRKDDGDDSDYSIPEDKELDALLAPYISTLSRQLTSVLKERRATKLQGLHKTGKLQSKNAYRVLTDEQRIFSRKNEPDKADYKITMLLDASGSMRNKRIKNAYIGGYLLYRVFQKLGFTVEAIQFDDTAHQLPDYTEYRKFRDNRENDDAGALKLAYEHRDTTKDNIVLIFSDGAICTDVKPWITKLHKAGSVLFAVGIGITGTELVKNYGQAVNVPQVENLPSALISILKRLIHR